MSVKVINFVSGLDAGGVGALMKEWYRHKDKDITFDVATICGGLQCEELTKDNCNVVFFESIKSCGVFRYIKNAYKIIKQGNYDVVHSHVGVVSGFVFIASIFAGVKIRILHAHATKFNTDGGSIPNRLKYRLLRRLSIISATDYCACSNDAAVYFFGKSIAMKKTHFIHNGVDLDKFRFCETDTTSALKYIGYIGRFEKSKNHIFLLKVFNKIHENDSCIRLLLLGNENNSELVEYVKANNLENYVEFLPPTNNTEEFYSKLNVFAFPSLNEGLGIVAIEAQACGVHCLLSPGIPDEAMVSELAEKEVLDMDLWAEKLKKMCYYCKKDVKDQIIAKKYDIVSSSAEMMELYHNLLESRL